MSGENNLRSVMLETDGDRRPEGMRPSPFFNEPGDLIGKSSLTFAIKNNFPVVEGHAMILPNDPVYDGFALAKNEVMQHHDWLKVLQPQTNKYYTPDGVTIAWNYLFGGGQSIAHAHLHWMPRWHAVNEAFDINPRGGLAKMPFPEIPGFYQQGYTNSAVSDDRLIQELKADGEVIAENELAVAIMLPEGLAIKPGHSFVFPKVAKRSSILQSSREEMVAQIELVHHIFDHLSQGGNAPDGANFGWDVGQAAGQIGSEGYLQFIPRHKGDVASPRGGFLKSIPDEAHPVKSDYYDMKNVGKDVAVQDDAVFHFYLHGGAGRNKDIDLLARVETPSAENVSSARDRMLSYIENTPMNGTHKLQVLWALGQIAKSDPLYVSKEHGTVTLPVGALNIEFAKIQAAFSDANLAQVHSTSKDASLKARYNGASDLLADLSSVSHDARFDGDEANKVASILSKSQQSLTRYPLQRMDGIVSYMRELINADTNEAIPAVQENAYLNSLDRKDGLRISHEFMAQNGYVEMNASSWQALIDHDADIKAALLDRLARFDKNADHDVSRSQIEKTLMQLAA